MAQSLFAAASQRLIVPSPLRALTVVAVATLLSLVVGSVFASRQLLGEFRRVEDSAARQRSELMLRAYDADYSQLLLSTRDYAEWDTAQQFVVNRKEHFIQDNFHVDSFRNLHIDLVIIVAANGAVLGSVFFDRDTGQLQSPASNALLEPVLPYVKDSARLNTADGRDHVVPTDRGAVAVAVTEITRSDRTQATGAKLLFGRLIRNEELTRYRATSQLTGMGFIYLRNNQPVAGSALPELIGDWIRSGGAVDAAPIAKSGDNTVTSYALVRTPERHGAVLFTNTSPRVIYAAGFRSTWMLLAGIGLIVIGFGLALFIVVMRLHRSYEAHQFIESRYRNIAGRLGESILLVDANTLQIVDANDAVLNILAFTRAELAHRIATDVYPDLDKSMVEAARNGASDRLVAASRMRRSDGSFTQVEITISQLNDAGSNVLCLVAHDITHRIAVDEQQKANQKRLLHLAQHDPLTGLPNRLYLRARLPRVLKYAAQNERSLALVYLDIDHFKNINDSRGHGFGDKLLQIVAQRLRNTVGSRDAVVRMGGDEFVIVASLDAANEALDAMAGRLQAAIAAPISIDGTALTVTASIGVSVYPRDGLDPEVLLKHADIALYQAKEAGRSCHRLFVADMDVRVSEDVALEQALRHAIDSDQLYMDYQPVVDLQNRRITSFEALMRWRHPELGLVPPGRFVPIAEKSGLILALGQHAITQTLKQLRGWLDAGIQCVPIAVNVAPQQLIRTDFPALVKELSAAACMEPSWLRFEITETAFLQNPEQMIDTLTELREIGCQILIDDFGTGYSALSYLKNLPVDVLKIDRSFVVDLTRGTASSEIIGAIVDMAQRLKLATVAEGVESKEQALLLRKMGCQYAQGFLFSSPLSARRSRILLEKMQSRNAAAEAEARGLLDQALAS
jgi:diguanylate cyclase (GGDEF)-like protein/PAS domain S-box-containing protein